MNLTSNRCCTNFCTILNAHINILCAYESGYSEFCTDFAQTYTRSDNRVHSFEHKRIHTRLYNELARTHTHGLKSTVFVALTQTLYTYELFVQTDNSIHGHILL